MELVSLIIAVASFICSILTYFASLRRERRQATLEAYRELQTQVLDKLNCYTPNKSRKSPRTPVPPSTRRSPRCWPGASTLPWA